MNTASKKNFYDILEVSSQAGKSTINAAFERLKKQFLEDELDGQGLPPDARFQLIKDAYFTLSDEDRRAAYDDKIFGRRASVSPQAAAVAVDPLAPVIPGWLKFAAVLLVVAGLGYYYKSAKDADRARMLEQERIVAEQKKAEEDAALRQKEEDLARLERERMNEERRQEENRRRDYEQAKRDADSSQRRNDYARQEEERREQRRKWEAERVATRSDYQRRQDEYDAQARLERDKALVRQMERDNNTGGRVAGISAAGEEKLRREWDRERQQQSRAR